MCTFCFVLRLLLFCFVFCPSVAANVTQGSDPPSSCALRMRIASSGMCHIKALHTIQATSTQELSISMQGYARHDYLMLRVNT